ncbi:hypothetical protein RBH94_08415 [Aestuariibaculum sp. YM273]|uniref:hypothetical protein n=1 Tax=Aestuariibaculum sp. YM273 TaxID=3070659 RepID=UPI0027DD8DCA|nr:hypothetical protein [Aestuariibaculum sp. YM273]WMI64093.1 hypothetical protein RBH94_08415 [Aestuariibaculum sp. YM273]
MTNTITYQRKLIGKEVELGFLYVPAEARPELPNENAELNVLLPKAQSTNKHSYNSDYNRVFGLTSFYRDNNLSAGSIIEVEVSHEQIKIKLNNIEAVLENDEEEDDENFIDMSGLSSQMKGNIGEDWAKEIILLYSQGLLNVYKPVIDDRGIDLIVLKEKLYTPIYLQVKTRFNVHKRNRLILTINGNTFKPHHSYYIVAFIFDQSKMKMSDKILLIPSQEVENLGVKIADGNWRITVSMAGGKTTGKYKDYFVSKEEFVNTLLDRIETISSIVR